MSRMDTSGHGIRTRPLRRHHHLWICEIGKSVFRKTRPALVDVVPAGLISFFEKTVVKIVIYVAFGALVVLRILKHVMRRKAIVINHSSFSNAQSTYDEDVVAGCWVSQVDINLVSQVGQGKITDAIHVQDDVIKKILDRCDEYTELIYFKTPET